MLAKYLLFFSPCHRNVKVGRFEFIFSLRGYGWQRCGERTHQRLSKFERCYVLLQVLVVYICTYYSLWDGWRNDREYWISSIWYPGLQFSSVLVNHYTQFNLFGFYILYFCQAVQLKTKQSKTFYYFFFVKLN